MWIYFNLFNQPAVSCFNILVIPTLIFLVIVCDKCGLECTWDACELGQLLGVVHCLIQELNSDLQACAASTFT